MTPRSIGRGRIASLVGRRAPAAPRAPASGPGGAGQRGTIPERIERHLRRRPAPGPHRWNAGDE